MFVDIHISFFNLYKNYVIKKFSYQVSQPTGFEYVPCQNGEMGLQSSGKGSDYNKSKSNGTDQTDQTVYYKRRILKPVAAEVSAS